MAPFAICILLPFDGEFLGARGFIPLMPHE